MHLTLFELSASLFDSIFCVFFIFKYIRGKSNSKNLILSIATSLILFGVTIFGDYFFNDFDLAITISLTIISLIYAIIVSKKQYLSSICAACIFEIAVVLLSTLLFYIFSTIFKDFDVLLYGENSYARYIYVIAHKILLTSILTLILHFRINDKLENINGIVTFAFSIITVVGLGFTMIITEKSNNLSISLDLLTIAIIFLVLNILLYILLSQISKLQKKNYSLMLLSEIEKHEEKKYQESLSLWTDAQKIRHDFKNHMIAISTMLECGKSEECKNYINEYFLTLQNTKKFSQSGNSVLDYLIDSKLSDLENTQIIITGSVGNLSDIQDIDLASLMGNILDNAIEAQNKIKNKYIELSFSTHNNTRIIICKNAIEKSVLKYNKTLQSTKKGSGHGYGSKIIAEIVKKYNGIVHYFEEENLFGIQIILPELSNNS